MARKKTAPPICIVPRCPRKQHARGLCSTCYRTAKRMIENGEVTEEQLIQRRLMLSKSKDKSLLRKAVSSRK